MSKNEASHTGWWQRRLNRVNDLMAACAEFKDWKCNDNHSKYVDLVENHETLKIYFDLSNVNSRPKNLKSSTKASSYRLKGNQYFAKKKFTEALECYNEGITCSPQSDEHINGADEYALCLANRSATTFHLFQYESCLADIEEALKRNYQPEYRLLVRRGHCLYHLNKFNEARECCLLVQDILEKMPGEAKLDQAKSEIKKLLEKLKNVSTENRQIKDTSTDDLPKVKGDVGSTMKQASNHVRLEFTANKGRYLVADKNVDAGDVLIVEKPYASLLLPPYYLHRCYHCLKDLYNYYPCPTCNEINFCSSKCSSEAFQSYHGLECSFMHILHEVGIAHLALRILVVTKLSNILELRTKLEENKVLIPDENSPLESDYEAVYHLVHNSRNIEPHDMLQYAMTSILLLRCLDSSDFFNSCHHNSLPEIRSFVGGLLLRHVCQLVCNGHAIMDMQLTGSSDRVESEEQVRIATAIYPTVSMMNHSCMPNIFSTFRGDVLVVMATSPIEAGQEIFNCYGPHYKHMSTKERQEKLKEQYGFICTCSACTSEDNSNRQSLSFKCNTCQGKVIIESLEMNEKKLPRCSECGVTCSSTWIEDTRNSFERSILLFQEGLSMLQQENVEKAKSKFKECYRLRTMTCHRLNFKLAEVIDVMAQCEALQGNFIKASSHLRLSVEIIKDIYGSESLEYAQDLRKYSEVCLEAGNYKEASERAREALGIFVRFYEKDHGNVKELTYFISKLDVMNS